MGDIVLNIPLYKCCASINVTLNSNLMADRKHMKHRITKKLLLKILGRESRLR